MSPVRSLLDPGDDPPTDRQMRQAGQINSKVKDSCLGRQERLSAVCQNSIDSRLRHKRQFSAVSQNSADSSHGSWNLPSLSEKTTPPSSVETASLDGGSKSSSRTTSSDFDLPASHQSSSRDDEPLHTVVEVTSSDDPWISLESTEKTRMGPNYTSSRYHQISCLQAGLTTQAVIRSFPWYFPRISTLCRVPYSQRWRRIESWSPSINDLHSQ